MGETRFRNLLTHFVNERKNLYFHQGYDIFSIVFILAGIARERLEFPRQF